MAGAREILFDSVKALERHTAGLHILSPYASSTAPKEHILYEILGKVMELVGADAGSIILADEAAGIFNFVTLRWTNLPALQITAKEKAIRLFRVPLTEGIVGQVYQSREPVILPDVSKSQTFRKDMADAVNYTVHHLLAVPIQTETRRVGVLELFNKVPRGTFSAQDMELAVGLAHHIALILEVLHVRETSVSAAPAVPPTAPPPASPPPVSVSNEELMEARRVARDAQAQLKESQVLLETAMQAREQSAQRVQSLTEELEKVKSQAAAATPPEQMMRLLHSVEPFAFTLSLDSVLKNFGELSARVVNAQALQVFVWDNARDCFSLGFSTVTPWGAISFKKGEGVAGHAADRMELIQIEDVTRDDHFSKTIDEVPGILSRSILAAPLVANGRLLGVLEAINRKDGRPFVPEDGVALAGLALLGAAAVDKALTHQNLESNARAVLAAISDLIETREPGERGRAERLRWNVSLLSEGLGMNAEDRRDLEWATLLFNAGKIILPSDVLFKPGDLVPKDRELLMSVPRLSSDLLAPVPLLAGMARMVRHVNERWDGQGAPDKLAGEKIPLGSRVIAVVDAYDGLTVGVRGRRALPTDVALKEMETCAGKQFDPACVDLLKRLVRGGKIV